MKIIEALKELKLIRKKIKDNTLRISTYASRVTTEPLHFASAKEQSKEILSLIESNMDHVANYLKLKRAIDYTNITTMVTVKGRTYSISDLLVIQNSLTQLVQDQYQCLSFAPAQNRLQRMSTISQNNEIVTIEKFYDETYKNTELSQWIEFSDSINPTLEVINATTDIVFPDDVE